jgi:hypothetical protein
MGPATSHHARDFFNVCSARNQSSSGDPQGRPRDSQYSYANSAIALSSMLSNRESALLERLIGVSGNWGVPSGCRCSSGLDIFDSPLSIMAVMVFVKMPKSGHYQPYLVSFPPSPQLQDSATPVQQSSAHPQGPYGFASAPLFKHATCYSIISSPSCFARAAPIALFTCFSSSGGGRTLERIAPVLNGRGRDEHRIATDPNCCVHNQVANISTFDPRGNRHPVQGRVYFHHVQK